MLRLLRKRSVLLFLFVFAIVAGLAYLQIDRTAVAVDLSEQTTLGVAGDLSLHKAFPIHDTPYLVLWFTKSIRQDGIEVYEVEEHVVVLDLERSKRVALCSWETRRYHKPDYWGLPIQSMRYIDSECTIWLDEAGTPFLGCISSHLFSRHAIPDSFYSFANIEGPVEKKSTVIYFTEQRVKVSETRFFEWTQDVPVSFLTQIEDEADVPASSRVTPYLRPRHRLLPGGYSWVAGSLITPEGESYLIDRMLAKHCWENQGATSGATLDAVPIRSVHSDSFLFVLSLLPSFDMYKVTLVPDSPPEFQHIGAGGIEVPVMAFDSNNVVVFQRLKRVHSSMFDQLQTLDSGDLLFYRRILLNGQLEETGTLIEGFPDGFECASVPLDDEHFLLHHDQAFYSFHYTGTKPPERIFPPM